MSINKNIFELRKFYGYSQEEIANKLNISRQTFIKFENGTSELTTSQIQELANIFGIDVAELYYEFKDTSKFKQMLIYILKKFRNHGVSKTKLAKLLYLSDFYHYYYNFESMSNVMYRCKDFGPLAEPFLDTIDEMYNKGELHIEIQPEGAQMLSLSVSVNQNDFVHLSEEEKKEIDQICAKWGKVSVNELVNFTHNQKPWMACRPNEVIPYDLILQEDPSNVF